MLDVAQKAIGLTSQLDLEYCESRVQKRRFTRIVLNHGRYDQATYGMDGGIGIRVLYGNAWGFSSSTSVDSQSAVDTCCKAASLGRSLSSYVKEDVTLSDESPIQEDVRQRVDTPPSEVDFEEKMRFVRELYDEVVNFHPSIVNAEIRYGDSELDEVLATSEGTELLSNRTALFVAIDAVAKSGEKMVSCSERFGKLGGYEVLDRGELSVLARSAATRSVELLDGNPAPSGRFTVVTDPRLTGVFAHEAIGHACEADAIVAEESILRGRLRDKVGSDLVTICDDSTLLGGWGSQEYDSEGVKTQKRTLVEKGILTSLIYDRKSAGKLEAHSNGGARTQSYAYPPIVRMSNTYVMPGDESLEELLEGIDHGILLKGTRGGEVDVARGVFQFNAEEARLIEKGEPTSPVLDVSMSGLILETLSNISGVSNDFELSIGTCGKSGQGVPVGDGGPFLRVENVVVGGRTEQANT